MNLDQVGGSLDQLKSNLITYKGYLDHFVIMKSFNYEIICCLTGSVMIVLYV